MDNRIPLPTDNIYKFYALFGLVLFVFGFGALIFVNKSTNEFMYQALVELETLKALKEPSIEELARRDVLEKKIEIEKSDKALFLKCLNILIALSVVGIGYGFWTWHYFVQPLQDEISRLQRDKLKYEVEEMRRTTEKEKAKLDDPVDTLSAQDRLRP